MKGEDGSDYLLTRLHGLQRIDITLVLVWTPPCTLSEGGERRRRAKKESEYVTAGIAKAEGAWALGSGGSLQDFSDQSKISLVIRFSCVHLLPFPTHVFCFKSESFTLLICCYLFAASQSKSSSEYSLFYENSKSANMPKAKKIAYKKCHQCRKDRQKVSTTYLQSGSLDVSSVMSAFCDLFLNLHYSNRPLPFCRVSLLHLKPTICAAPELTHHSPLPFFEFFSHLSPRPETQSEPYVIFTASSSSLMRRCWLTPCHPSQFLLLLLYTIPTSVIAPWFQFIDFCISSHPVITSRLIGVSVSTRR